MTLDRIDKAILAALQGNARMSLGEIGTLVGLTGSPCWTRIKRLEDCGVIEGYSARINATAVGLADTVIVQVTLDNHSDDALAAFGRALEDIPEVIEVFLMSGEYDYCLRVVASDTRDYERVLRERVHKIPGIRHSKSTLVLRQLKRSLLPIGR